MFALSKLPENEKVFLLIEAICENEKDSSHLVGK
jgi:hypothetical protein